MKAEEALALLHSGYRGDKRKEFEETVEEALKRQIPMKPNYICDSVAMGEGYEVWECHCPRCFKDFDGVEVKFCSECGQFIDWSE